MPSVQILLHGTLLTVFRAIPAVEPGMKNKGDEMRIYRFISAAWMFLTPTHHKEYKPNGIQGRQDRGEVWIYGKKQYHLQQQVQDKTGCGNFDIAVFDFHAWLDAPVL